MRLARFVAPYRLKIVVALLALVVAAGCVLALGQGLKHVVDRGFGSADADLLNAALGAIIGVAALLSAATYVRFYLMMTIGERVVTDLRREGESNARAVSILAAALTRSRIFAPYPPYFPRRFDEIGYGRGAGAGGGTAGGSRAAEGKTGAFGGGPGSAGAGQCVRGVAG